ncbi:MAG: hypothetical protein M1828_002704 [Chrysothrix sp. TS-e1954]|nr:MAG: hypothetical protein M1828_002704 [Chrysothrix sp. TS-e1954]
MAAVFSAILLPLSLWGTSFIRSRSRFLRNDLSPIKTSRSSSICSLTFWTLALDLTLLIAWLSLTVHPSYHCSNVCDRCIAPSLVPTSPSVDVTNTSRSTAHSTVSRSTTPPASQFYIWAGTLTCSCSSPSSSSTTTHDSHDSPLRKLAAQVLRKFKGASHRPGHGDSSTRVIAGEQYSGIRSGLDAGLSVLLGLTLVITVVSTVQTVRSARRQRGMVGWEMKGSRSGSPRREGRLSVYYVDAEKQARGGSECVLGGG